MSGNRTLKFIHIVGTAWFVLCIGYILVLALRQAGFHWWLIFSLSGHSVLLVFLLISLYLFAIFRGIDRSQKIEIEHPLTDTSYYAAFYGGSPFLGGLAGWLGMTGLSRAGDLPLGIALGTLATTFLVWIVVDPAMGFAERLLPASRKHRLERLARVRALRQKRQDEQKRLLAEIEAKEELERIRWGEALRPYAEKLAALMAGSEAAGEHRETEAVNIGVKAWQTGGLSCMRQLRDMAVNLCRKKYKDLTIVDCISTWWDGIGSWRSPSPG